MKGNPLPFLQELLLEREKGKGLDASSVKNFCMCILSDLCASRIILCREARGQPSYLNSKPHCATCFVFRERAMYYISSCQN